MPGEILIDGRPLQGASAYRGIGTYVRRLLEALAASHLPGPLAVLVDGSLPVPDLPPGLQVERVRRRYRGRLAGYEDAAVLGGDLDRIRPALYHATTLSLPSRAPCPVVATLHDLIPWAWGGPWMVGERLRYYPGKRLLSRAESVLAVSETSAADGVVYARVQRERIQVIPEGAGSAFRPGPGATERVATRWDLSPPFLLYVGALDRRKDPVGLVRAWRAAGRAGQQAELVIAGSPGAQAPGHMGGARLLGQVTDDELADLYRAAACLVFPSRYEGFGLPVLEAMACGCPVTGYANPAVAELAGDAAKLVPVGNVAALGMQIARLLADPAARRDLGQAGRRRAAGYRWEKSAKQTAEAYSRAMRLHSPSRRR